ncbi:carbonic anhydrase [Nadsonia fulvescens var. elongata DSM 6958]|uniref:Carbonic anhydrase n=1 Tax=Nadsonia fulvescens var. elongata DSM 6958 TaxID=857566 RepID=A0A1E3PT69_9ASCO|nr:carbonic anhydrase [Nadsonia fulvescens var. elongata DSM 6958]
MSKPLFRFGANDTLMNLLSRNQTWASRLSALRPSLFPTNAQGQSPQILWIGCSDSRAGEACLDLLPGEVFVHRNIANIMPYGDLSSLSVIQFAVDVLKVKHIIICGHYDCGGVWASLTSKKLGILDHWLKHIRDTKARHKCELDKLPDSRDKANRLVELNVCSQVHNLKRNDVVMDAMKSRGLEVHGLVYDVGSGLLKELEVPDDENEDQYSLSSDDHYAH